ncbi:hypothetical protein K437DRAFT_255865 [Tilletiaria anomala UBC 951]|uniref:Uncharacterized protein n=1 Tax=Tilletiaria anomala (strain ATCC 24038 / CBS 436.72 / UBC 951) TaxID=1037660 RepID=A0A066W0S9_TILAU|nr:uncharacterized protein K437DRAFT_255865 [Tilletiaria anomala UBC 951]KDN47326.1 hypothetical protein K437DRAFT_255865 [Tilletiaria anomala UBC 951]
MADKQQLIDMGFAPERVDWALRATRGKGIQEAMDHLVEHSEEPVPPAEEQAQGADAAGEDEGLARIGDTANSIKCTECGKQFRNQAYAQFHAEKSGHTDFEESTEEIKPLTEEERKARLDEMRSKLAEKRAKQALLDKEEARANELIRRKAGKETLDAREELKRKEAEKDAARKLQEKMADIAAKERVRAQIEADKHERAEKVRLEKLKREGKLDETAPVSALAAAPSVPRASGAGANAKESRLRVRLNTGEMWSGSLDADSGTLRDVEQKVIADGKSQGPKLELSTTFPRRIFTEEEKGRTLRELGLVPNAALEASATQ